MKEHKYPAKTDRMWIFTSDPQLKEILPHFLSPLEMAVANAELKLQTYQIGDFTFNLDYHLNLVMRDEAKKRIKFFYYLIRRERIREARKRNTNIDRFLLSSPTEYKLSKSLQYKLSHNKFFRMEQLAEVGRGALPHYDRMGQRCTDQLVTLFEIHGCGDLI